MNKTTTDGIHVGQNIDHLQNQLGVTDEALQDALGLSYSRFWDLKRRNWAQKKTVDTVAEALSKLSGARISAHQVLSGRLEPDQFAVRAVREFVRAAEQLERTRDTGFGGIRLPRLHLGALPAGPAATFEAGDPQQVVQAMPGDFVVTADGDCMFPTLADGDQLICLAHDHADDQDVVVVGYAERFGEWQTGIKRLRRDGDRLWLTCDNPSRDALGGKVYGDIYPHELRIHGVVVGLWRPVKR